VSFTTDLWCKVHICIAHANRHCATTFGHLRLPPHATSTSTSIVLVCVRQSYCTCISPFVSCGLSLLYLSLGFSCFECISPFCCSQTHLNMNIDLYSESHTADRQLHLVFNLLLSSHSCLCPPLGLTLSYSHSTLQWSDPDLKYYMAVTAHWLELVHLQGGQKKLPLGLTLLDLSMFLGSILGRSWLRFSTLSLPGWGL
jgi:hypothetical protein